ncbi:MAG: phosphoribosyltransferase family protein [Thermomicrobiales bacterium]
MELERSLIERLTFADILRYGHFALRNGRHSGALIDRDLLLADPAVASRFGYHLAKHHFTDHIETIATPSIWGAGLAQWVGYFLEPKAKVIDATPKDGQLTIAPKLESLIRDRRVLLVDNLLLTGETMGRLLALTSNLGAKVVGIATLWSSGENDIDGKPVYAALNDAFPAWAPDDCPLCALGESPAEIVRY